MNRGRVLTRTILVLLLVGVGFGLSACGESVGYGPVGYGPDVYGPDVYVDGWVGGGWGHRDFDHRHFDHGGWGQRLGPGPSGFAAAGGGGGRRRVRRRCGRFRWRMAAVCARAGVGGGAWA